MAFSRQGADAKVFWNVIGIAAYAMLAVLVIAPLLWLVFYSLRVPNGPGFTLQNYYTAFTDPLYLRPLLNSLRLGVSVALGGILVGVPMAWLVSRTNMPGRSFIRFACYSTMAIPPFLGALAWVLLAGPNAGFINRILDALVGVKPFNIFTMTGLSFVVTLYLYAYTFIFTCNALDSVGAEVEQAAAILGAPWWKRALTITLPLALPAILSAVTLTFLQTLSLFGTPAIIGIPAGRHVMTTQLYLFFGFPPRRELGAAYGIPLLAVAFLLLWVQRRLLGRRKFDTVGGKGLTGHLLDLGRWKWGASALCVSVLVIAAVLPLLALLYTSLQTPWSATDLNFTLKNYVWVWNHARPALVNTLTFAAAAATGCALLAMAIGYLNERHRSSLSRQLEFLATAPVVIPGMLLAIGMFAAYSRKPLFLYGTPFILIAALWGRFIPVALDNIQPTIKAIHPELEEASRNLGGSALGTLRRITIPLARSGFTAAWLLTFILAAQEMSASILLVTINTKIIPTFMFDLYGEAAYGQAAALGIVLTAIILAAVAVGVGIIGVSFMRKGES